MTAEDWKNMWPSVDLMESVDRAELPPLAREFVRAHRLPKVMIFEAQGDNASMSFEWAFKPLLSPLVTYNSLIRWGDFYEPDRDRLWSRQLAIGSEDFCNGSASICIHDSEEYTTRIDCELSGHGANGFFVNSSLPQFGQSMLTAINWSAEYRTANKNERRAGFAELVMSLIAIDPVIKDGNKDYPPFWPTLLDAFDKGEALVSFDIMSEPSRSKPRF